MVVHCPYLGHRCKVKLLKQFVTGLFMEFNTINKKHCLNVIIDYCILYIIVY